MADAAVEFLLNNLKELLLYHSHLITDTEEEIGHLKEDLLLFNAFLKESLKKRKKDEVTKALVQSIRNVVYELEDIIDAFITQAIEKKQATSILKFLKPAAGLHDIGKKIETIRNKVEGARKNIAGLKADEKDKNEKPADQIRHPREKDVVGFTDVIEELTHRLIGETDYFDVVSLIGMFGLGKTTIAWKIFNDPAILYKFPVRVWVSISQEFSDKDIFLNILKQVTPVNDATRQLDDIQIARLVAEYLKEGSFLIVMDDIWKESDWGRLRVAIPLDNRKGKVMITSRIKDVGNCASSPRPYKALRFFTEKESLELLRLEALHEKGCTPELEPFGKVIAKACDYLPLALVIVGGILSTKYAALDTVSMIKGWEKVSQRVGQYIKENDAGGRLTKFISLSYDSLPYHLRDCFLYMGMFPEDYQIPSSKLIRMWIGEGFIQRDNDRSLEETGDMYLEDLINRNLVTVDKLKADGKVKTCRVHDTLRDFCRNEAGNENENFLQEIKFKMGKFVPEIGDIDKYRHLSIHSNCIKFISEKPCGPHVRSFVCFSNEKFDLPEENNESLLTAFKLLRVLDVKPMKFTKMSSDMYKLVHTRYIALSCGLAILPPKFGELWNIQTLVVDTTARKLDVKADIWKLSRLRHFKTNVSTTLPKPSKSSKHGAELQTLGTIAVESCTAEILQRACNLTKLGIRGRLASLLEGKIGSFETLGGKMDFLEKLKLVNDVRPRPSSEGRLSGLPQAHKFPPNLKSLTLVATFLDWNSMTILGMLEKLEVLKLKENAFKGSNWKVVGVGFPRLEFLQIQETDLSIWEASSHHFPRLKRLVLKNCEKLLGIPIQLAEIASLESLELYFCKSAAASAKDIQEAKKKTSAAFKISIFPAIE